jgi:hypothetical protein
MSRLTTPNNEVGKDYVIGTKGSRYFAPSIQHVDQLITSMTERIRRWEESEKFPELADVLLADRDLLLSRRLYLMEMLDEAKEPAA